MRKNHHAQTAYSGRDQRQIFIKLALFFALAGACACGQNTPVAETNTATAQPSVSPSAAPVAQNAAQEIEFKGVRVRSFISRISTVTTEETPAAPLEDETHKPDYVESRSITFGFESEATQPPDETFYGGRIRVFPVDEFRQAYAVWNDGGKGFDKDLAALQKAISRKIMPKDRILELHSYDVSSSVTTRVKQLDFKNGKGIFFLTEYVQETSAVDNNGLRMIYQGLTNDGKYYVTADFSVSLTEPNVDKTFNEFKGFNVEDDLLYPKTKKPNYVLYEEYLKSLENLLNQAAPEKFTPNLKEIEKTISSLEVNWRDGD